MQSFPSRNNAHLLQFFSPLRYILFVLREATIQSFGFSLSLSPYCFSLLPLLQVNFRMTNNYSSLKALFGFTPLRALTMFSHASAQLPFCFSSSYYFFGSSIDGF
jgi:hypothetical protein